jgi:hypothetical protein
LSGCTQTAIPSPLSLIAAAGHLMIERLLEFTALLNKAKSTIANKLE